MNNLKDVIYNNREKIGLKEDISFNEIINLENLIKEQTENDKSIKEEDIKLLVKTSMEMKELLEECRKNKLPIKLADKIDNILNKINHL